MLFVIIPRVPTTVHVNLDILEMDELAKVNVINLLDQKGNKQ